MKNVLSGILMALLLGGCGSKERQTVGTDILATVGELQITKSDLEHEIRRRTTAGQKVPPASQVLEELVTREALVARAIQLGLDRDDTVRRTWQNSLIAELKERELKPKLDSITIQPEAVRSAVVGEKKRQPEQMHLAVLQLSLTRRTSERRSAEQHSRMVEARE